MRKTKPTDSELQILHLLWTMGPSAVKEIHEELQKVKESGYTTTLKLLQIMYEKKLVDRVKDGRVHIYKARISRQEAQENILDKLIDTAFQGSAGKLIMQALGHTRPSRSELKEIRDFLDKLEGGEK